MILSASVLFPQKVDVFLVVVVSTDRGSNLKLLN